MQKIKVLFTIPNLKSGGAERVFLSLMNHIDRNRFEPYLVIGVKHGEFLKNVRSDIEIIELKAERARGAFLPLIKTVRRIAPHTVFSTLGMNFAASLGKPFFPSKTRVVLREGSSPTAFLADVERNNPTRAKVYRQMYKYVYAFADKIICQSDFMSHDIESNLKVDSDKICRIYNPVDFQLIDSLTDFKANCLGDEATVRLVSVGRLSFEKGYDILLNAFAIVRKKNPQVRLMLIGDGDERERLENLALHLNIEHLVDFVGFSDNPYSFIKNSDIFILPSRYEGFSNVLVESLACKVPVVVTDCPSANREVVNEGINGWFAENENHQSLADTINLAISDRRNLDLNKIRELCEERFAIEKILIQYEKEIEG
jgi:glycosyltransferase involved in cell wall biosynthesis